VRAPDGRRLAAALLGNDVVAGVTVDGDDVIISSTKAKELALLLPRTARDLGVHLVEVRPLDDSLESLFRELVR
jgi:ABC-2 type transport system ATP-binding protein